MSSTFLLLENSEDERIRKAAPTKSPADEDRARESLTAAFAQAIQSVHSGMYASAESATRFAAAMTEVVLGKSSAVILKPDLMEPHREAAMLFLEKVVQVSENIGSDRIESAIAKLADVMLPDDLAEARGAIVSDNLAIRDHFVAEIPCLTSVDVGRNAGHRAGNQYATAARWKKSGAVLSVSHRGAEYFPAFQFRDDGQPHPVVKRVLSALPEAFSNWQRALWFVSTNGWLDDKAPMDSLDEPDAVVAAARREREGVVG